MGIARDVFEILDTSFSELSDKVMKRFDDYDANAGSISRRAADGTLQFPLIVSRAVGFENAQKVAKATEFNAASFAQIVMTMNPNMDTMNNKSGVDYVKQFHTNIDTTDDTFGNAMHFINTSKAEEGYIAFFSATKNEIQVLKEELEEYGAHWREGKINDVVQPKYIKDNTFVVPLRGSALQQVLREKLEAVREAKKPSNTSGFRVFKNDELKQYTFSPVKPNAPGWDLADNQDTALKDYNDKDGYDYVGRQNVVNLPTKHREEVVNKHQHDHKFNHNFKTTADVNINVKDSKDKNVITGTDVVMRDLLKDNDVKKANDLAPTLLHIRVIAKEERKYVDFVIGVKATMHPVDSEEMINELVNACRYHDELFRFIRWTTGEISFLGDFLLNLKDMKSSVARQEAGGSPWWNRLRNMGAIARFKKAAFMKKRILPNASIALTQQEVDFIKNNYGFDLMQPKFLESVMNKFYLLCFIVVDEALEVVHFKYDGQRSYQTISFSGLEKENSNSARQFRDILKAVQRV